MCNCFDNKVGFVETVMKAFGELFIDETKKGIKLQTMEYKKQGSHIIVDQGKNQIAGYTDIKKGLFEDVPVIIFGDHTRVIKYVDQPFFLGADGVKILRSKDKNANYKYLYYALRNANIPDTGYNRHFKWLKETKINYPSVARQDEIVRILDKLSDIIDRRKTQLQGLDSLIKARFVEMFGDPVANDKRWDTLSLESACKTIIDCPHSTPSYTYENTGFMCIRTSIVKKNRILWDDIEYIPEDEFEKRIQRKKPTVGDIVYTREGAILGIAAIIDRNYNVALGQRSMLLSPDTDKCASEFLCVAMNSDSFLDNVLKGVSGSASPHINVGDIKAFKMIMPPVELQNQFAEFIQAVDKSKLLSLIKLLEQLITYLYNVFIIYQQDKGEEVENHE